MNDDIFLVFILSSYSVYYPNLGQSKKGVMCMKNIIWICVAVALMGLVAITIFKVPIGTVMFAGALLACPLLHIWMMKDGGHKH